MYLPHITDIGDGFNVMRYIAKSAITVAPVEM